MKKYELSIPDMSCQHCVNRISGELERLGVGDFDIDLDSQKVTLETDNLEQVLSSLDDIGYTAEVENWT